MAAISNDILRLQYEPTPRIGTVDGVACMILPLPDPGALCAGSRLQSGSSDEHSLEFRGPISGPVPSLPPLPIYCFQSASAGMFEIPFVGPYVVHVGFETSVSLTLYMVKGRY